ncbi:tail fiber protein [Fulvivirga ulvae]|uniref:tail fiber protein n=1 Tax=Fulvivirga ulvae TaxID=2904245 RepID=UPI001F25769D|nr:tail fiber protein [Fulvivirga ulvae]UII31366.1 tail fiber protein [Fulvivirga ulvae]
MEINKKNRSELKNHFLKNKIPTQEHFAQLVDAGINQAEDGIAKVQGSPLALQAEGEEVGTQGILDLYTDFSKKSAEWSLNLNPRVDPLEPDTNQRGLNIKDKSGKSRLFIRLEDGKVGIGTIEPESKLTIHGSDSESALSVVSNTKQHSRIFEVTEDKSDGKVSVRGGDTREGVRLSGAQEKPSFVLGKLGLGTENPAAPLSVQGAGKDSSPDASMHITSSSILFGGPNQGKNENSAKISIDEENALKIHGMASGNTGASRKVKVFAEGGMNVEGPLMATNFSKSSNMDGNNASDERIPTQKSVKSYVDDRLPKGVICMWSGDNAPAGWALCNGENGTPDLTGRFIVGLGGTGDYDTIGNTGGQEQVTLTTAQLPAHSHSGSTKDAGEHNHSFSGSKKHGRGAKTGNHYDYYASSSGTTGSAGKHSHSFDTNDTGGSKSHENRPPYYVLAYIIKL